MAHPQGNWGGLELYPGTTGYEEITRLSQAAEAIRKLDGKAAVNIDNGVIIVKGRDGQPMEEGAVKLRDKGQITPDEAKQLAAIATRLEQQSRPVTGTPSAHAQGSPLPQPPSTKSTPEQDYKQDKAKIEESKLAQGQQYKSTETGRTYERGSDGKIYIQTIKPGGDIWILPKATERQDRYWYIHSGNGSFEKADVQSVGYANQSSTPFALFWRSEDTKRVFSEQGSEVKPDKGIYHFPNGTFARVSEKGNLRLCDAKGNFLSSPKNQPEEKGPGASSTPPAGAEGGTVVPIEEAYQQDKARVDKLKPGEQYKSERTNRLYIGSDKKGEIYFATPQSQNLFGLLENGSDAKKEWYARKPNGTFEQAKVYSVGMLPLLVTPSGRVFSMSQGGEGSEYLPDKQGFFHFPDLFGGEGLFKLENGRFNQKRE